MSYCILMLGAGGPASVNFAAAALAAGHRVIGADPNPVHLPWIQGYATLCPNHTEDSFHDWLQETCERHLVDAIHAQPDPLVTWLATSSQLMNTDFPVATFLPDSRTLAICQDKFETSWRWAKAGLRPSAVQRIEVNDQLREAGEALGYPFWLRATRGAGARGATKVDNHAMGEAWIAYWTSREVDWEWIAEEYLPGRDSSYASIWRDGELVTSFARERLEYIYPYLAPSGRTGTPVAARTFHDPQVNAIAKAAILAVDPQPHGVFCVDIRENAHGLPIPTEINAGRTCTTVGLYHRIGVNFADVWVKIAMGEPTPDVEQENAVREDMWVLRHIDCPAKYVSNESIYRDTAVSSAHG